MPFYQEQWFLDIVSITSIISFTLSIITFFLAISINSKVEKKLNKKVDIDYLNSNCIIYIDELQAIQENIRKDNIFSRDMAGKINRALVFLEEHSYIIYKKRKKKILNCMKVIKFLINKDENSTKELNEIADNLDLIVLRLDKEKNYGQR